MNKFLVLFVTILITVSISCKKDNKNNSGTPTDGSVTKIAPDGFNFSSSKNVAINITLRDNNDGPLAGIVLSIYAPDNTSPDAAIFKGVTDQSGTITASITVPAYYTKVIIDPSYIGLLHNATGAINDNKITAVIGGKAGYSGDIVADPINNNPVDNSIGKVKANGFINTEIGYPTGYTASNAFTSPANLGRPAYLESTGDVIDASLLAYVNASLPESSSVPTTHPEYLSSTAVHTINVTAKSDVWVTFVSEGAGYQNTLAYYTYKTNNPPSSASGGTLFDGIDKITYIFPNASSAGSGGGLKSGDKVKLGTFDAGTSIGFVLLQNAWGGNGVNTSATKFYSQDDLNPENTSALRKHSVMLYDDVHKLYLLGFEDVNRQPSSSSDNDFNDLVVYATSNPVTGISNTNVPVIDKGNDADGDGVADNEDAFPNDGTRAYISYYPSQNKLATIAFEDNWPNKGDYDLNDLVVNYRYTFTSNAKNQVVELKGEFSVAASGASFHNGFGVQLPVGASAVSSVTGQHTMSNYITFASNGAEAGQSKAVIIPFDNHEALIKNFDGSYFINTKTDKDKVTGSTATVTVKFSSPVDAATLTVPSFNPFLISNLRRGYEIHLPGYTPTDKADLKLFNTGDDNSTPTAGRYYQTKENLPWAISFSEGFSYPIETININQAYLHFTDWAASGGTMFTDWYTNPAAGYRTPSNIYSK